MAREQLKTLTEPMYYVLLSLIRENHGYGIMQMISELTEGRVAVGAGTLYALLGRFEKEDFIRQITEENRRKVYTLTEKGQEILKEEYERLNKMVNDGHKFMEFDGDIQSPPDDKGGTGITMPVEEPEAVLKAEAEVQAEPVEEPKTEDVPEVKEPNEPQNSNKKFSFGGLGKGRLIPT